MEKYLKNWKSIIIVVAIIVIIIFWIYRRGKKDARPGSITIRDEVGNKITPSQITEQEAIQAEKLASRLKKQLYDTGTFGLDIYHDSEPFEDLIASNRKLFSLTADIWNDLYYREHSETLREAIADELFLSDRIQERAENKFIEFNID